jgi:ParB family transcriptional regulator, chromosome partitioning protein
MSRLRDKAATINLDAIDAKEPDQAPSSGNRVDRPRTAVGLITTSLAFGRSLDTENARLKERLNQFDGALLVRKLDPTKIHAGSFANRGEWSFSSREFSELKNEIAAAGENVQPILVRPAADREDEYLLVFGHRRHRACLELGLPVNAVVQDLTEHEAFIWMDRENRNRANLSIYEQGCSYKAALDRKLFPSLRMLAKEVGVDPSNVSKAIAVASLPREIVAAFRSPNDIQQAMASPLSAALESDSAGVLQRAALIQNSGQQYSGPEVFRMLLSSSKGHVSPMVKEFKRGNKTLGNLVRFPNGKLRLSLQAGVLGDDDLRRIEEIVTNALK